MEWRMGSTIVVALLSILLGCADAGEPSSAGTVQDSAGIRIIDLPESMAGVQEVDLTVDPSWTPAAGIELGDLGDVDVVQGRGVLLLDELAVNIRVLSNSGDLLAVMGRDGQGPGEFDPQGLSRIVTTDSSVIVPDLFLQRLTEFALDGEVLGTHPFPLPAVYAVDWRSFPGGGLAFRAYEQFGDQIIRMVGETVDTIFSSPLSNDFWGLLLPPQLLWDLSTDGDLVLARSDQGTVDLRREGMEQPVWRARWADPAEGLREEDVSHLEDLLTENILRESPDISPELLAQNLATITYPDQAPKLAGILAAPNGDVWVQRAKPVREMGVKVLLIGSVEGYGGRHWEVLDPDGFLKARVRLPESFTPRRFSGEWIYGILEDELGVETAARVKVSSAMTEGAPI